MSADDLVLDPRIGLARALQPPADIRQQTKEPSFTINGRFAMQPLTGVQRYALEVAREIEGMSGGRNSDVGFAVPRGGLDVRLATLQTKSIGPFSGHLWEQVTLPLRCRGPLLNLCNTAPLLARKSVVCIHDANVFATPQSYSVAFRSAYRFLIPRIVQRAEQVATVSRHAARELARYSQVSAARFHILPNGHEHALRWNASGSCFASKVEGWQPYVLVVGSLAWHKNIARVIRLAEPLGSKGISIVVVGTDRGPFAAGGALPTTGVRFLGRTSDDDLGCLMDQALCLAFPSLQEGFGIPVIEAMARGCPVVASDASCLPEICGDAALLTNPSCGEDWLRNIVSLSRSAARRDELVGRGRENARRFSWRDTAAGYLDLMAKIA